MNHRTIHNKQRRGSLIVVVLLIALVTSLLASAVLSVAKSLERAEEQSDSITIIYDGIAMADIFTDAFLSDLDLQYRQEPVPVGEVDIDRAFYETMIANAEGFISNMNMTLQTDGRYLYNGDATLVAEDITFEDSFSGGIYRPDQVSMETRFFEIARLIGSFQIYLNEKLTPDATNANNILEGETGDRYYLEDVIFSLQFSIGIHQFQQTYCISNLYAQFTHSGMIMCDVQTDEAVLILESQSVS